MPVTEVWIERLAAVAIECRPTGAKQWDMPGTMAAIRRVAHLAFPDVASACVRAGSDRSLDTPAAIGDVRSSAWRERLSEPGPAYPPKAEVACRRCGKDFDHCVCEAPAVHLVSLDPAIAQHGAGMARALLDEKRGVPHHHTERVEGCFRCDLSADETAASRAAHPTEEAS